MSRIYSLETDAQLSTMIKDFEKTMKELRAKKDDKSRLQEKYNTEITTLRSKLNHALKVQGQHQANREVRRIAIVAP